MFPTLKPAVLSAIAASVTLALASPAGHPEPSRIRLATFEGVKRPVYYSIVDGRYHRIAETPSPVAEVAALSE